MHETEQRVGYQPEAEVAVTDKYKFYAQLTRQEDPPTSINLSGLTLEEARKLSAETGWILIPSEDANSSPGVLYSPQYFQQI